MKSKERKPIKLVQQDYQPTNKVHRDMPEDPRLLAKAMFNAADRKIEKEGRAAKNFAPRGARFATFKLTARIRAVNYSFIIPQ